jgi:hypothetical protein
MYKFMILTGSDGNPRSFPPNEVVQLEETYPYILRSHFKDSVFWQLSFGNITSSKLLSQPLSYLTHWNPDIIIVQTGMVDCRPEAFSDFQKEIISKFTWKFFSHFKKYIEHPLWIKRRQLYKVPPDNFRILIKKFKQMFPKSKIFWLEICAGTKYEETRPGLGKRMDQYNAIIRQVYGEDMVPVQQKMLEVNGFNGVDHVHWNKRGQQAVAEILLERINAFLGAKNLHG